MNTQHPQQERADRWNSAKQLLIASRAARGMSTPDESTLQMQTQLWLDALDTAQVPSNLFRSLLAQCLASREWTGPVGVDAIIKQYRQHVASQPAKTLQELDRESGRDLKALPAPKTEIPGRLAYRLLGERMLSGKGNVACDCGKPATLQNEYSQSWTCGDLLCSFAWPVKDTLNAPHANKPGPLAFGLGGENRRAESESTLNARAAPVHSAAESTLSEPLSDAALLDALAERCNFGLSKTENDTALRFARWLLKVVNVDLWTPQIARREWGKFHAESANAQGVAA